MAEFKLYEQSVALPDVPSALEEWLMADEQILIRLSAVLTLPMCKLCSTRIKDFIFIGKLNCYFSLLP